LIRDTRSHAYDSSRGKGMKMGTVSVERLKQTFIELASIESPSRREGEVAWYLRKVFSDELGHTVLEDASKVSTRSNTGNIIVRIPGGIVAPPLLFNAHMDTVEPSRGVKVRFEDGVFKTDGTTILGGDDKAACAILVEIARVLKEHPFEHPPLEFVFTVCEEIGLLGAKTLDLGLIQAKSGYALDATGTFNLINRAPTAVRFSIRVRGRSAHAGIAPEQGVNAIILAAKAIVQVPQGRIDQETTANIGLIKGGKATNIVPDLVEIEGEVRSHDEKRLREVQDKILGPFHRLRWDSHEEREPVVQVDVATDYPLLRIPEEHPLVTTARSAAKALGRELLVQGTGGGSDANVLCGKGIDTAILGIGMEDVHTTKEQISLRAMVDSTEFILEIIRQWRG